MSARNHLLYGSSCSPWIHSWCPAFLQSLYQGSCWGFGKFSEGHPVPPNFLLMVHATHNPMKFCHFHSCHDTSVPHPRTHSLLCSTLYHPPSVHLCCPPAQWVRTIPGLQMNKLDWGRTSNIIHWASAVFFSPYLPFMCEALVLILSICDIYWRVMNRHLLTPDRTSTISQRITSKS